METRIIVTGSQTSAIKARRHLESNGIKAKVVRAPKNPNESCRFGVEVSLSFVPRAKLLFDEARINYSDIIKP